MKLLSKSASKKLLNFLFQRRSAQMSMGSFDSLASCNSKSGFSLLEIVLSMAVLSIIAAAGLPIGLEQYRNYILVSDRNMAVSMMQKARAKAMNNIGESSHGMSFQSTDYVIFRGTSYASRNSSYDQKIPKSGNVTISGTTEFVFNQLSGSLSSAAGDVTLTSGAKSFTISINSEGRISW